MSVNGEAGPTEPSDSWLTVGRDWAVGDEVILDLALDVRLTPGRPAGGR